MKKHAIIPIFITHRGCPNACVFCNQRVITTRTGDVTVSDAKKTIEEWLTTLENKDIETEISFFGGSFTGIPMEEQTEFLKLAKEYKDSGRISKIHCSTRPDYINPEILENLRFYGMDTIELGVQSLDPRVLELSKRGHTADDVYKACDLIKEYGFTLGIQLMIGLPGDSYESCMYSAEQTVAIKPQIARLYPTVVLPETELYTMREQGIYKNIPENEMLRIVKDMYKLLNSNNINVIRIGLKSNELVKNDTYHDAFGQLVKSSIALDFIKEKLDLIGISSDLSSGTVIISANSENVNYAVGHKASNKEKLMDLYPRHSFKFIRDENIDDYKIEYISDK